MSKKSRKNKRRYHANHQGNHNSTWSNTPGRNGKKILHRVTPDEVYDVAQEVFGGRSYPPPKNQTNEKN